MRTFTTDYALGPGVGLGHKYRMVALADALTRCGWRLVPRGGQIKVYDHPDTSPAPDGWTRVWEDGSIRLADGEILEGLQYALLRAALLDFRQTGPVNSGARYAVVSIGGSDTYIGWLPRLMRLAREIAWICEGPTRRDPWRVFRDADLVICPASTVALEAACMGIPTITFAVTKGQQSVQRMLGPATMPIGEAPGDIGSLERRQSMRDAALGRVDGKGAERVARALVASVQARS